MITFVFLVVFALLALFCGHEMLTRCPFWGTFYILFGAVIVVAMLLFFIQLAFYAMLLGGIGILLLVLFVFFRDRRRL